MQTAFAPGKIILSGEYAVIFGYKGVAVPLSIGVHATFEENGSGRVEMQGANAYVEKIAQLCKDKKPGLGGTLSVRADIPIGKGLGSSSATVITVVRVLLGEDTRDIAREVEMAISPQSALDFTTIWDNAPIIFQKDAAPRVFATPDGLLQDAVLIDTGKPSETTSELVAWMKSRETEVAETLRIIDNCTERFIAGEPLPFVMRDHHRAQVALGVVPLSTQDMIADIEQEGGAAKIIGAGGRTGKAGMVLALGNIEAIQNIADERGMHTMHI